MGSYTLRSWSRNLIEPSKWLNFFELTQFCDSSLSWLNFCQDGSISVKMAKFLSRRLNLHQNGRIHHAGNHSVFGPSWASQHARARARKPTRKRSRARHICRMRNVLKNSHVGLRHRRSARFRVTRPRAGPPIARARIDARVANIYIFDHIMETSQAWKR